jgi:hypothetical protein
MSFAFVPVSDAWIQSCYGRQLAAATGPASAGTVSR